MSVSDVSPPVDTVVDGTPSVGTERDQAADERDLAADQRDELAGQRDQLSEQRDQASHDRDQASAKRDADAGRRDRAAEARDRAGAKAEDDAVAGSARAPGGQQATARRQAASDRKRASRDRRAGADERTRAELDRGTAAADREAGADERTRAELDRGTAAADREAGAGERTDAVHAEGTLRRARNDANVANLAKREFLATMSHEIRTPLNGVIGMIDLLLATEMTAMQRDYAETAKASGEVLLTVVNGILDFSKIEAGKIDLEEIDFDLRVAVEESMGLVAASAHAKGLEVLALVEPGAPVEMCGDPGRLRQIMTNLLANAVKFTEEGEIVVRVGPIEEIGAFVDVRVEVSDSGIGISPDACGRLFEIYAQGHASTTRRYGGTGLGLAICKQLVGVLGGDIGVTSEKGHGSTFWFTARFRRRDVPGAPSSTRADLLRGVRALVVDDSAASRDGLEQALSGWQMRPTTVGDGATAIAALRTAAHEGDPFVVAIVDEHMPAMSGAHVASAIRGDPEISATRLVLLTSPGHLNVTHEPGATDVAATVSKPVRQSSLLHRLTILMRGESPPARLTDAATTVPGEPARQRHLLVVDDNLVNLRVAALILEGMGHLVDVATNGLEALDALSSATYDAVLMDCQMPELDGYDATREIRLREAGGRRTPIVAMTAGASRDDEARCVAAGMDAYVAKPIRRSDLDEVLQASLWSDDQPFVAL